MTNRADPADADPQVVYVKYVTDDGSPTAPRPR